jgi:hypothetical protein
MGSRDNLCREQSDLRYRRQHCSGQITKQAFVSQENQHPQVAGFAGHACWMGGGSSTAMAPGVRRRSSLGLLTPEEKVRASARGSHPIYIQTASCIHRPPVCGAGSDAGAAHEA